MQFPYTLDRYTCRRFVSCTIMALAHFFCSLVVIIAFPISIVQSESHRIEAAGRPYLRLIIPPMSVPAVLIRY
jgi:hypothetical protein